MWWALSFSVWLSLRMVISRPIHGTANVPGSSGNPLQPQGAGSFWHSEMTCPRRHTRLQSKIVYWERGALRGKQEGTQETFPGEFHGLYSPWGHRESDTTEQLSLSNSAAYTYYTFPHVSDIIWYLSFSAWLTLPSMMKWSEVKSLSRVWFFATPWTVTRQAPPSKGFSRQDYWSGLPFPSPGDLPDPGSEPRSPELQADCFNLWAMIISH